VPEQLKQNIGSDGDMEKALHSQAFTPSPPQELQVDRFKLVPEPLHFEQILCVMATSLIRFQLGLHIITAQQAYVFIWKFR